jgi:hypothetical protein
MELAAGPRSQPIYYRGRWSSALYLTRSLCASSCPAIVLVAGTDISLFPFPLALPLPPAFRRRVWLGSPARGPRRSDSAIRILFCRDLILSKFILWDGISSQISIILRIPPAANPYADSIVSFIRGKPLWIVLSCLCCLDAGSRTTNWECTGDWIPMQAMQIHC